MSDGQASIPLEIRAATAEDADAVEAIAEATWPDREGVEYLPQVFEDWLDRERARTVVAEVADPEHVPTDAPAVAGIAQCLMLSDDEAWAQGMRVHPAYHGRGVGSAVVADGFEWAREQGATVVRNMVYAWNGAGLGQSRATGFEPATELRFVHPEPIGAGDSDAAGSPDGGADLDAAVGPDATASNDPAAAWRTWTHSDAREHLRGLAADDEESWAVRELTPADLAAAAEDGGALAVETDAGLRAMAARTRIDRDPESDDGDDGSAADERDTVTAVYGACAWDDRRTAAALFDAIATDAAAVGADETKVLIPETVQHVSDAAACRVPIADEPDFVLAASPDASLTRR